MKLNPCITKDIAALTQYFLYFIMLGLTHVLVLRFYFLQIVPNYYRHPGQADNLWDIISGRLYVADHHPKLPRSKYMYKDLIQYMQAPLAYILQYISTANCLSLFNPVNWASPFAITYYVLVGTHCSIARFLKLMFEGGSVTCRCVQFCDRIKYDI